MANLQTLPNELILRILGQFDVARVLALGQTCKRFHSIAFSKSAWVNIVLDLRARAFIDRRLAPDPGRLTSQELIALVKRVVQGPISWNLLPGANTIAPKISARAVIDIQRPREINYRRLHLLPGGEHLFLLQDDVLECYAVVDGHRVWTSQSHSPEHRVLDLATELASDDKILALMILSPRHPAQERKTCLELIELVVRSGSSTQLFWLQIDDVQPTHATVFLAGDHFMFDPNSTLSPGQLVFAVGNWRKGTIGAVSVPTSGLISESLADGFLGLLTTHDTNELFVKRLSIVDVAQVSTMVTIKPNEPVELRAIHFLPVASFASTLTVDFEAPREGSNHSISTFTIFKNPLSDDTSRIWFSLTTFPAPPAASPTSEALHRLSLSYPLRGERRLELRRSYSSTIWRDAYKIFFSGHTQTTAHPTFRTERDGHSKKLLIHPDIADIAPVMVKYCDGENPPGVPSLWSSPYSGNWAYFSANRIIINYFE
ncbi:hypothetical protein MKEN_01370600 [Mycena kentingensis (nom. inval.)]|nr:hypothetical protein MKEN_01370600 [Mycena kentingensis (nom. inval.)]